MFISDIEKPLDDAANEEEEEEVEEDKEEEKEDKEEGKVGESRSSRMTIMMMAKGRNSQIQMLFSIYLHSEIVWRKRVKRRKRKGGDFEEVSEI